MSVKVVVGWIVLAGALWLGCRVAPGAQEADHDITASDMEARISFLSSDMLRGRATPSRGLEIAADYVAAEFRRFGLESPSAGFIERYQLAMSEMGKGWALVLRRGSRRVVLGHEEDFWGLPWAAGSVEGGLRYVGSEVPNLSAPGEGSAIWVARLSPGVLPRDWLAAATQAGAVGLIFVFPKELEEGVRAWLEGGGAAYELGDVNTNLPAILISEETLGAAIGRLGLEIQLASAPAAVSGSGIAAQLTADLRVQTLMAPNVVGILRGSDPRLRDEYVLLSAHMDHVGVGPPLNGDSIYNGADDNASGTAAVVEMAEAAAAMGRKPKRSLIFLTVSGEERGLLGSAAFVRSPPVPLNKIVANLNIDMIGRNWEDTISVIGKPYSTIGVVIDSVSTTHYSELRMVPVDDRWPSEGFFFRSDHFNFARKGIPAVFFFNGVHEDYHRPSDEVEKINFAKAARVTRLIFEAAVALANVEQPPRWDPAVRESIVEGSR